MSMQITMSLIEAYNLTPEDAKTMKSQADLAAHIINVTDGGVTPEDLTNALRWGFPRANIGTRHGPHYLCLARTGKLSGVKTGLVIPKGGRKAASKASKASMLSALESRIAELEAALAAK